MKRNRDYRTGTNSYPRLPNWGQLQLIWNQNCTNSRWRYLPSPQSQHRPHQVIVSGSIIALVGALWPVPWWPHQNECRGNLWRRAKPIKHWLCGWAWCTFSTRDAIKGRTDLIYATLYRPTVLGEPIRDWIGWAGGTAGSLGTFHLSSGGEKQCWRVRYDSKSFIASLTRTQPANSYLWRKEGKSSEV